jgi:hypothetical protein
VEPLVTALRCGEVEGAARGQSGAVTIVQRCPADLKLNPLLHFVALDGVLVAGSKISHPVFYTLLRISKVSVADLRQVICARFLRYLVCPYVVEEVDGQTRLLADNLAELDPALVRLAPAAVSSLSLADPEQCRKPFTVVLYTSDEPKFGRPSCVEVGGFSFNSRGFHDPVRMPPFWQCCVLRYRYGELPNAGSA